MTVVLLWIAVAVQGTGIMDKEASRINTMRHAAQKMKQVLHVDRANYNTEWLQTNR